MQSKFEKAIVLIAFDTNNSQVIAVFPSLEQLIKVSARICAFSMRFIGLNRVLQSGLWTKGGSPANEAIDCPDNLGGAGDAILFQAPFPSWE